MEQCHEISKLIIILPSRRPALHEVQCEEVKMVEMLGAVRSFE
jgi:hypothetical protein